MSRLAIRTVNLSSGRTTMRLEPEFWDALNEICQRERMSLSELVRNIDGEGSRTSAVRVHALAYFRTAATAAGHASAGHGSDLLHAGGGSPA